MGTQIQTTTKIVTLLSILFAPLAAMAQYCTPTYMYAQCNSYDMYIQNFSTTGGVTNITNNSTGCGNASTSYTFYNKLRHAGVQDTKVNFSVSIGASYQQGITIYVDYNGDGDFTDANEKAWSTSTLINPGATATGSFTIPLNATVGVTRMRVRSAYSITSVTDCAGEGYGEAEDYEFEVLPKCSSKFYVEPSNVSACENSSASFVAAGSNTDAFQWQANYGSGWVTLGDDLNHSGTSKDSMTVKNLSMSMSTFQYRAVAINNTEKCSVNSKAATLTMVPGSKSSIVISPSSPTEICENTEVAFSASWTNGGRTPQYQWTVNGSIMPGETNGTLKTSNIKNGDSIACILISSNICVPAEPSNTVGFIVNKNVVPEVKIQVSYEGGQSYTFTAQYANGGTNPVFQWTRNTKVIAGVSGDSYFVTDMSPNEKIYVRMISKDKCVLAENRVVSSNMIVANMMASSVSNVNTAFRNTQLSPNPGNGTFVISGMADSKLLNKDVTVRVTNTLGQLVFEQNYAVTASDMKLPISLNNNLANGVYRITINANNELSHIQYVLSK